MEQLITTLKSLAEPSSILLIIVILLIFNSWIFKRLKSLPAGMNVFKNAVSTIVVLVGSIVFILALPIDKNLKGQVISFLGIIVSAGIALSSTTILGNLIAGIMNNSMNRFRNGDLIKIGDIQGRVTKRSILHTEIQLEDSNFITIPNLYIATNPVKLTRKTNTVISASVSLGYDVSRVKIEEALKEAALATGLTDPYVYITELGDFSVVYKIHGFLDDSNKFFSTRSLLNGKVMDLLHKNGIEIVSPTFMNQRRVDEKLFIPKTHMEEKSEEGESAPEELVFDEAIKSEEIEKQKDILKKLEDKHLALKEKLKKVKDDEEKEKIKSYVEKLESLKSEIEKKIEEANNSSEDH